MADQAASVEEREGEVAGSADQQGQPGLLRPQPVVLGVRQVSLGPLDHPAIRTSKRKLLTESKLTRRVRDLVLELRDQKGLPILSKDILEFYIFMLSGRDLMSLPVVWRSDLVSDRPRHQM